MALERAVGLPTELLYPVRFVCVAAVLFLFSRSYLHLRPSAPLASVAVGIAVFVIWIGPDVVFGPGYRHHWLFENSITGAAQASIAAAVRINTLFIVVRVL